MKRQQKSKNIIIMKRIVLLAIIHLILGVNAYSQIRNSDLGAWYMYFWNVNYKETPIGLQGDVQYRNWNVMGDLEQLLLRGGFTYKPKQFPVKFTLGYGHITTGGIGIDDKSKKYESRIYQEALWSHALSNKVKLSHRIRYEQRFIKNQDLRTRYRYNLFVNVLFNKASFEKGVCYLACYNELFVNGQRNIGNGQAVNYFDRNRFYVALGYGITAKLRIQTGIMNQVTNTLSKSQLQLSLHHKF